MQAVSQYVEEPAKKVPVGFNGDVVVVGSGIAGSFAALGAARSGADTLLIERFSSPGGNMGPGMIVGGNLTGWPIKIIRRGFAGIPAEFLERHAAAGGGSIPPYSDGRYVGDSNIASAVLLKMMEEEGVRQLFSTFASDPILESSGNGRTRISGLFIENKSGRQVVKARVVIDATGEADLARRGGIPVIFPKDSYHELDTHAPGGSGLCYAIGGVDWVKIDASVLESTADSFDWKWVEKAFGAETAKLWKRDDFSLKARNVSLRFCLPSIQKSWEQEEFRIIQEKTLSSTIIARIHTRYAVKSDRERGIMEGRVELDKKAEIDWSDGTMVSEIDAATRIYLFDLVRFLKAQVPGFERCYLNSVAPYFGSRGGACIQGEYTLTTEDCRNARRFDDVVYRHGDYRALKYIMQKHGEERWTDVPYRVMVPKDTDGLMAVGRCASSIPDTLLRNRPSVMHMGQVGGMAAALAVQEKTDPGDIDVKELQRRLLGEGFYLGNADRLKELKLF